jgi:hypothetical protein
MTPKQRVLRSYPKAVAKQWATKEAGPYWNIEQDMNFDRMALATDSRSARAAWAAAWERIKPRSPSTRTSQK